jgi:hypothetical protein
MSDVRFEVIRPGEFDDKFARLPLIRAMGDFGDIVISKYNRVVKFWHSNTPKFSYKLNTTKTSPTISVTVTTDNPVFGYLDQGVAAHPIYPTKAQVSGTAGTYVAGSLPGTMSSSAIGGYKPMNDNRYLNLNWVVPWPGIEARRWSQQIAEEVKMGGILTDMLQEALNKSAAGAWK